jgi:thiosulfate dehydrogenase [quinone] large subunit
VSQRTSPSHARRPSAPVRRSARHRRVRFDAPPPQAFALSGWALLPLRAFLGATFAFAGLQKLANPTFFDANSPSSIQAQLIASIRISPLHDLLGHLLRFAVPIGIVIALAELAVGLGALLGLWTRVAAAGGMLLACTLFLTVSYHSSPYYTGADIVFVFAWIPLVLAGSGGVLSVDALIAARVSEEYDFGPPAVVPVRFSLVQRACGQYQNDTCAARKGAPCDVRDCPFLLSDPARRRESLTQRGPDEVDRRTVVLGGSAVAAATVAGVVVAAAAAGLGRAAGEAKSPGSQTVTLGPSHPGSAGGRSSTTSSTTSSTPRTQASTTTVPAGTSIGTASQVPVGGAARFTDPQTGDPGLVLQPTKGQFVAYDAVCPHVGCTVGYSSAAKLIVCPCPGSSGAELHPCRGRCQRRAGGLLLREDALAQTSFGSQRAPSVATSRWAPMTGVSQSA